MWTSSYITPTPLKEKTKHEWLQLASNKPFLHFCWLTCLLPPCWWKAGAKWACYWISQQEPTVLFLLWCECVCFYLWYLVFFLIWFYSWLHNRSSASVSCQLSSSCHSCIHLWLSSFTVSHSHNKETDHRESMALLCLQTEPSCHSEHTAHLYLILTLHRHHILFCQCRILLMQNHFFSFWQKNPQKLQILPIWKKSSENYNALVNKYSNMYLHFLTLSYSMFCKWWHLMLLTLVTLTTSVEFFSSPVLLYACWSDEANGGEY